MNRTLTLSAFVDEIHKDFTKNRDTNYIFFLGAGCSKSSGIPLAGELALEWYKELQDEKDKHQEFVDKYKLEAFKDESLTMKIKSLYFPLFEILFPDALSRQKEIQRLTEDKYPALGYYELAQLMKEQAFNTVITTNFDDLIYDALIYSSTKRPRVISHHDLAHYIDRGKTPHIIKLHGDAHLHPFNDSKGTQEIEEPLRTSVVSLLNNTKLIVIGYGGGDESIAKMLQSASRIAQVYWLNASSPEETTLGEWWKGLDFSTFIDEYDFDRIMSALGNKFGLEKPQFKQFCNTLEYHYSQSIEQEIVVDEQEAQETNNLDALNELVSKLMRLEEYDKGLRVAKEAVEEAEKVLGTAHLSTATTYNNLGVLYENIGEYKKAQEYYQKDLEVSEKLLGTEHPDTATIYNNRGLLYKRMGEPRKALEHYQKALEIYEKILGIEHPDTATTYNNLGALYASIEESSKALEYYQKALKIREKVLGVEHPNTATSYNNLGLLYESIGESGKALEYYQKALKIREKVLGVEHPDTAITYNSLGLLYESIGEPKKALEYCQKALEIYEKVLGVKHPDTATTYNNLGFIYQSMGEYKKAQEYFQKALYIFEKVFPAEHDLIGIVKENMKVYHR